MATANFFEIAANSYAAIGSGDIDPYAVVTLVESGLGIEAGSEVNVFSDSPERLREIARMFNNAASDLEAKQ